jgi:hypothetical protein
MSANSHQLNNGGCTGGELGHGECGECDSWWNGGRIEELNGMEGSCCYSTEGG